MAKRCVIRSVMMAVLLTILNLPANASQLNTTGRALELQMPLLVNTKQAGQVLVRVEPDDSVSLEAEGALELLETVIEPAALEELAAEVAEGRLDESAFTEAGFKLTFNTSLLQLELVTPQEAEKTRTIALGGSRQRTLALDEPATFSAFLNVLPNVVHRESSASEDDGFQDLEVELDGGANLLGTALEFEATYENPELDGEGELFRDGTRLVRDNLIPGARIRVGDVYQAGRSFLRSLDVLGVGVAQEDVLLLERSAARGAGRSFRLTEPSDVEVWVNGGLVRRLNLEPGTYDLRGIPLAGGSNNVELVITDRAGRVTRIPFFAFAGGQLLPEGETEYAFNMGRISDLGQEGIEYGGQLGGSAYLMRGVTQNLSLGLNAQGSEQQWMAGTEVIAGTPLGALSLETAFSDMAGVGQGQAARLSFDVDFGKFNPDAQRLGLTVESLSANFSGFSADVEDDAEAFPLNETRLDIVADYGRRLSESLAGSIGIGYQARRGEHSDLHTLAGSLTGSFPGDWLRANWSINAVYEQDPDSEDDGLQVALGLSLPLGSGGRVRSQYQSDGPSLEATYRYDGPFNRIGSVSTEVGFMRDENSDLEVTGFFDYTGNRFLASADHNLNFADLEGGERLNVTRLRTGTALVFADGHIAMGRPIGDSFAIVHGHQTLEGRAIKLDDSEDGPIATSGLLGAAVLPSLGVARPRSFDYAVDDLPSGYDIGSGVFTVAPFYKGGYVLQVGSAAVITMAGTLVDETQDPLGLVGGELVHLEDPDFEKVSFFTNRIGRFAIMGLQPGRYRLELFTEPTRALEITVPDDGKTLINVETLVVPTS